jgi:catechol 2,3-dioxygenase-like lactoylglutathione lyase family enzyme
LETSYQPYRDLRLGFRLVVHHEGPAFIGAGEKYLENGRQIPVAVRSPIRIQGRVETGSVIEVTFQEDGRFRRVQGQFRLTMQDRQHLTGTFVSTAANARGASQWIRASARQEGRVRPLPPDQGAPPEIALVAPVQGQQVTTARVQVRGTAIGALGIVQVDVQVNGEPRVQRLVPGTATVDFSEPIALRHGPNDIVVTAFDPQHRAARQRVTVTRVEERPQASALADEPREPASAGRSTVREHRPGLQLGMSQTEVRDLLGAPVSVEATSKFVFWHYGPEQYVVFEQATGRVHGWVGVSS